MADRDDGNPRQDDDGPAGAGADSQPQLQSRRSRRRSHQRERSRELDGAASAAAKPPEPHEAEHDATQAQQARADEARLKHAVETAAGRTTADGRETFVAKMDDERNLSPSAEAQPQRQYVRMDNEVRNEMWQQPAAAPAPGVSASPPPAPPVGVRGPSQTPQPTTAEKFGRPVEGAPKTPSEVEKDKRVAFQSEGSHRGSGAHERAAFHVKLPHHAPTPEEHGGKGAEDGGTHVQQKGELPKLPVGEGQQPEFQDMTKDLHDDEKTIREGLTTAEHDKRLARFGRNELPESNEAAWKSFLKRFWGPMPIMIWISIILELVTQAWVDAAVLFVLQLLNAVVGFIEEKNAGDAIAALKSSLHPKCRVRRDGEWSVQDARLLVPGDLVSVKLGDVIPADGRIIETDSIDVDQSALTGESLPVTVFVDGKVCMGSAVKRGIALMTVTATGKQTFFGQAAVLMTSAAPTSRFQRVLYITTLGLMILSVVACAILFVEMLIERGGSNVLGVLAIVVIIVVASIPIATQVVATSTMAVGARLMAAKKAIVAKLSSMEELAGMSILCSDKTGTLTKNILSLREPVLFGDGTREELVLYSALASHMEKDEQDAIDFCIFQSLGQFELAEEISRYKQVKLIPFNPTDKRATALVEGPDNVRFKVCKGAPQVILRMACNKDEMEDAVNMAIQSLADRGFRALGVAVCRNGQVGTNPVSVDHPEDEWYMCGLLSMFDPPRDDTKATLQKAHSLGIVVKMVTGDQTAIARETCRELGMGTNILGIHELSGSTADQDALIEEANGFAEVMPEHKYQIVSSLQKGGAVVGMTGDGVNDAPALKRANIGIAVQGATDAAKAAADIVLVEPGLSVIVDAIIASRKIFQRMKNYSVYRIAATLQLLFFFFFSILFINPKSMSPGIGRNDFTLPVLSLVLITILNDLTMISIAYDKVAESPEPQDWDLRVLGAVSATLGFVPCLASLLLLLAVLACDASSHRTAWYAVALAPTLAPDGSHFLTFGEMQTVMYLKIAVADFLTLLCARTTWFMWERRPGKALSIAFVVATGISTLLAVYWPFPTTEESEMQPIFWQTAGVVWAYNLIWLIVQDACKVGTYQIIYMVQTRAKPHASATLQHNRLAADLNRYNRTVSMSNLQRSGSSITRLQRQPSGRSVLEGAQLPPRRLSANLLPNVDNVLDASQQLQSLQRVAVDMQAQIINMQRAMDQLQQFLEQAQPVDAAAPPPLRRRRSSGSEATSPSAKGVEEYKK